MSSFKDAFEHELNAEVATVRGAPQAKLDAWKVGGVFTDLIKKVIDSIGLGDLTRDEFLAIVGQAFDAFTIAMQIPPMLKPMLKAVVLMIAGKIYDKRHAPKPA